MNKDKQILQLEETITKLQSQVNEISSVVYKNNFTSQQVFNKASNFTTKLKVPSYSTLPTCEVGEVLESAGKLYICSATDTWTIVGTQS